MNDILEKGKSAGLVRLDNQHNTGNLRVFYPKANIDVPFTPEEAVRMRVYTQLVLDYGYKPELITFEHQVKMGSSYKRVDLAVFEDASKFKLLIIVECKREDISQKDFEEAEKQAFSYDNQQAAAYIWVSSLSKNSYYKNSYSATGRTRDKLADIPSFGTKNAFWYYIYEYLSIQLNFLKTLYDDVVVPIVRKKWFLRYLVYLFLFFVSGYFLSIFNANTLTPFAIRKNLLQNTITFKHLYWFVPIISTLLVVFLMRERVLIRAAKSSKNKYDYYWVACLMIIVPTLFFTGIFFDYKKDCYKCIDCLNEWKCWWSYNHFALYAREDRYLEYFVPFRIFTPLLAFLTLFVNWILKFYKNLG